MNAYLTTVCEFLRFCAAQGCIPQEVGDRLVEPRLLRHAPRGYQQPGEHGEHGVIRARVLKAPEIEKPPATLTSEQSQRIVDAGRTARDRHLLSILLTGGLRIGETLGPRREDMHLLPDAAYLGCAHRGAHLHVRPRQDNANGARAKSGRSRVVPLAQDCVHRYRDHLAERDEVPGAASSDYVFVNLVGPCPARPMTYSNAKQIIERIGNRCGFRARPHMMRHTAATRWIRSGVDPDVVQTLLGHVSSASTAVLAVTLSAGSGVLASSGPSWWGLRSLRTP